MILNYCNAIIIQMVDKSTRTKMPWRTSVIGEKMCCPIDECDVVSTFMPRLLLLML